MDFGGWKPASAKRALQDPFGTRKQVRAAGQLPRFKAHAWAVGAPACDPFSFISHAVLRPGCYLVVK